MKALKLIGISSAVAFMAGCASMQNAMPGGASDAAKAAEKESKAEGKLCQKMSEGESAVRAFPAVEPGTPLTAVIDASKKLEPSIRDLKSAGEAVNSPSIAPVEAAFDKLQISVNSVPGGRVTVGDSAIGINEKAHHLQAAWDKLHGELQCGA